MAIRILVVDDEPSMRELVISLLPKSESEYVVSGEAINGASALEALRKGTADIVITDIRMPVMDGLELIREAGKESLPAGFVVLSAYDEFHLVKEAFKLGARDYLLKSEVTPEELVRVLDRVRTSIIEEGKAGKDSAAGSVPLRELLEGRPEAFLRGLKECGLGENHGRFRIVTLRALGEKRMRYFHPEVRFSGSGLVERILGFQRKSAGADVFLTPLDGGVTGLFGFAGDGAGNERTERFFRFAADLAAEEGLEAVGGMSSFASDAERIPLLHREASAAESFWFFRGRGKLFTYSDALFGGGADYSSDLKGRAEKLRRLLDLKNAKQIEERVQDLLVKPFRPGQGDAGSLRELFLAYHACLRKAAEGENGEDFLDFEDSLAEFESYIRDEGTLDEYNRWLRDTLFVLCEILTSRCPLVRKTVEYVNSNFCKDLRLSEVARRLGVSEAHICRTFSKEMKCSFVQYLSRRRMNHALKLLRTTELKIYEIAELTGYSNTEHFSRTFKKIMGRSPKEYRW